MTVHWRGSELEAKVRQAAFRGVVRGTESVHAEATSLILETTKTGRVYRRRGVEHQASAPGEPFASDTGRAVQSGRTDYDPIRLAGTVTWSTDYIEDLEFGNQNMEPRPFARPALANRRDAIVADVAAEVRNAVKS